MREREEKGREERKDWSLVGDRSSGEEKKKQRKEEKIEKRE